MTQRNDRRAIWELWQDGCTYGKELRISDAAEVCVRSASGGRWEVRWSGRGNSKRGTGCVPVKLLVS